jgi:hypothetical protein
MSGNSNHFESIPVERGKSNKPGRKVELIVCKGIGGRCRTPVGAAALVTVTLFCDCGHRHAVALGVFLIKGQILSRMKEDDPMFARQVRMHLKADGRPGFVRAIDHEAIPALKKFTGFTGEIVLVSNDGRDAIGISLWDTKEHAETYNRQGYADIMKTPEKFTEGKPELRTYEVTNSTIEKIAVRKAA